MKSYPVVDLGCGRGHYSMLLAEQGYEVIACDFSETAIQFVKGACPSIETRCFDMISEFPSDVMNVGTVIASLSTHYFSLNDTIKLYQNISDILRPGGYFLFRVNSKQELSEKDKPHIQHMIEPDYYKLDDGITKRYFDAASVSELLDGFSVITMQSSSSVYHGNTKHYIECLAQKM
jgi:SAM-dependent methyltransferase